MRSGDLIDVLCEYGDMPMVFRGPNGERLVVQKIESKGDGDTELHIDLGFYEIPISRDPIGWNPDFTGL
jgi:hypothetical protein